MRLTSRPRRMPIVAPAALLVVGLALAGIVRVGAQAPAASAPPAEPQGNPAESDRVPPGALFVVIFSPGPNWAPDKTPPEQVGFREHGQNLARLRKAEQIVLGARYSDKGMIVMRATGLDAVTAELSEDPGVKAGLFTFEAHPFQPFYDGCLERPKR